ncbi:MAG: outer membrane beta-barrel protein [candidate division Zixibacteria bacterium]|nr:outer membrane beta-barrel protein [candidate division Zixibacteria bacterium]
MMLIYKKYLKIIGSVLVFVLLSNSSFADTKEYDQNFFFKLGGSWNFYKMSQINDYYIDDFAKENDILDDNIKNGPGLFTEFGYFIAPHISASLGISYLYSRIKKEENKMVNTLTISALTPMVKVRYHIFQEGEKYHYYIGGGMGRCFSKAIIETYDEYGTFIELGYPILKYKNTGNAWEINLLGGFEFDINQNIGLGGEIGYRFCKSDDLETNKGEIWQVEAVDPPQKMNLDFSGFKINTFISINL